MTVLMVVGYLVTQGCSVAGAAGITANLHAESGLDPTAVGRSGTGLPQYTGARRRAMLAALGSRWRDGYAQLEYVVADARRLGVWRRVCVGVGPEAAAERWMLEFERPATRSTAHRRRIARWIYGLTDERK